MATISIFESRRVINGGSSTVVSTGSSTPVSAPPDTSDFAKLSEINQFKANNIFKGDVTIEGNLLQTGKSYQTQVEEVLIRSNLNTINEGEVATGVTGLLGSIHFAGWKVDRGTSTPFYWGFDEDRDRFVVGKENSLETVATIQDLPTANYPVQWDATNNKLVSVSAVRDSLKLAGVSASNYARTDIRETFTQGANFDSYIRTKGTNQFYSTESGKTDRRLTLNTGTADYTNIYNYAESESDFKPLRIGSTNNATSLRIDKAYSLYWRNNKVYDSGNSNLNTVGWTAQSLTLPRLEISNVGSYSTQLRGLENGGDITFKAKSSDGTEITQLTLSGNGKAPVLYNSGLRRFETTTTGTTTTGTALITNGFDSKGGEHKLRAAGTNNNVLRFINDSSEKATIYTSGSQLRIRNLAGETVMLATGVEKFRATNDGTKTTGNHSVTGNGSYGEKLYVQSNGSYDAIKTDGGVTADTYFCSSDAAAVLGTGSNGTIYLRPRGKGDDSNQTKFTGILATIGTNLNVTGSGKFIKSAENIVLKGTASGMAATPYMRFKTSTDTSLGYIGYGSNTNHTLYINNQQLNGDISLRVGDTGSSTNKMTVHIGSTEKFRVDNSGSKTYGMHVSTGDLQTYGRLLNRNDIAILNKAANNWLTFAERVTTGSEAVYNLQNVGDLRAKGYVGSDSYTSGFGGSGWRTDVSGNMTVDSLTVRKTMNVYELNINKIRSGNGSYWFSDGMKVLKVSNDATAVRMFIDKEEGALPFRVGDIVRCQNFTGNNVKYYTAVVSTLADNTSGRYIYCLRSSMTGTSEPEAGDEIVRIGNVSDTNRQGAVYITSNDNDSPYVDVLDGVTSDSFAGKTKVRLGKLDGITSPYFDNISGYGLYAQNAFLEGGINASFGKIGGWDITKDRLTKRFGDFDTTIGTQSGTSIRGFHVYKHNTTTGGNRVSIGWLNDDNWGIWGTNDGTNVFRLGSTNSIAGWTFESGQLRKDNIHITTGANGLYCNDGVTRSKWVFRQDGSGELASGAISWDKLGNVDFTDKVKLSWNQVTDTSSLTTSISTAQNKANDAYTLAGSKITSSQATTITKDTVTSSYVNGLACSFTQGKIGSFNIKNSSLSSSVDSKHLVLQNSETDTVHGGAKRGLTLYVDNTKLINSDSIKIIQLGMLCNKDSASSFPSTPNYGFRIVKGNNPYKDIFRADNTGAFIANWTFDDTKLYSGNIEISSTGYIRNVSDKWRFNNDGSGILASGAITWTSSGVTSFSSTLKAHIVNATTVNAVDINASSITTGTLSASRIATGSLNANKITSNTITATQINVENIQSAVVTASKINTLSLDSVKGTIGAWTINTASIYSGAYQGSNDYTTSGMTIHKDGAIRAKHFRVDTSGYMYCNNGNIGGFGIGAGQLINESGTLYLDASDGRIRAFKDSDTSEASFMVGYKDASGQHTTGGIRSNSHSASNAGLELFAGTASGVKHSIHAKCAKFWVDGEVVLQEDTEVKGDLTVLGGIDGMKTVHGSFYSNTDGSQTVQITGLTNVKVVVGNMAGSGTAAPIGVRVPLSGNTVIFDRDNAHGNGTINYVAYGW